MRIFRVDNNSIRQEVQRRSRPRGRWRCYYGASRHPIFGENKCQDDSIRLKAINHITYNVKDKDKALVWYEEILGLKQIPKMVDSDHLYWLQLPSGAMVHIIENPDAPSAPSHHTAFEVDDIVRARDSIMAKGVEVTDHPDPPRRAAGLLPERPGRQPHRDLYQVGFRSAGLGSGQLLHHVLVQLHAQSGVVGHLQVAIFDDQRLFHNGPLVPDGAGFDVVFLGLRDVGVGGAHM